MNVFSIFCPLIFTCFLIFNEKIHCLPVNNGIYSYKGIQIPEDCRVTIRDNALLHPELLPTFRDMSPTDIEIAYICAKKFHHENAKKLDSLSETEKGIFTSVIEAPLQYIRLIKDTMLKNNFTENLLEMDKRLDTADDEFQHLHAEYYKLCDEYNNKLSESKKHISLLVEKQQFTDARNYPNIDFVYWNEQAEDHGYSSDVKKGPWYLNYNELDYVGRTTACTELRNIIYQKLLMAGHMQNYNNEEVVKNLRMLYNRKAGKSSKYNNVVFKKMDYCMAESFKSANEFLYKVEKNLSEQQDEHPYTTKEYDRAESIMNKYFPHNHVINELFKLINKYFQISIKECKDDYQIYAEGMKLYEVHFSNEKVGLFYVDYFRRKHHKVAPHPYTEILRYRVKELNIIPIVFISLQTKLSEKFSLVDVRALFHEIGHCLQFIFSDRNKVSTNFDTIEFPGKFMEFFTYQEQHVIELSAEEASERIKPERFRKYNKILQKAERVFFLELLHESITDLNIFARPEEDISGIIKEVRNKFTFKSTCDRTFRSLLPEFRYAGTLYTYQLSQILAIDAYNHLNSDPSKFKERLLKFRKLIFEMKDAATIKEAFQKFVERKTINVEPFYKFYGITSHKGLITI